MVNSGGGAALASHARRRVSRSPADAALAFAGLATQAALVRRREVSARQLTELALARGTAAQGETNPFRSLRPDAALAEADAADRRLAQHGAAVEGEYPPLLGVPVAVKDDTDLAGEPTCYGCAGPFPTVSSDGEVVRRLRAAGAVIIGKTNTPELGQWPFTEGTAFGTTRNPWDLRFSPGGSSGGSAAAVAGGVVAAALGSDGAGSVRIPAAWTHLVGIKPQRGRVSSWPDPEAFEGLTCIGPLARTVGDAALLLDAVAGNRPEDRHRPAPVGSLVAAAGRSPGRLRVGVALAAPFGLFGCRLDPEIAAAVEAVSTTLAGLGHRVVEATVPYRLGVLDFIPRSVAGIDEWVGRISEPGGLDPRTRANAATGRRLRPLVTAARRGEGLVARRLTRLFAGIDVLLAPTTARGPTPIGAYDGLTGWQTDLLMVRHCPYTWLWNVVGWPALNVPAGVDRAGLPMGVQLLGPACSEPLLVSVAAQLEAARGWAARRPPGY